MYNEAASDGATNASNPKIGEELVEGGSLAVVEEDGISTSGEAVPEGAPDSPPKTYIEVCLVEPEYSGQLGDGRLEWPPAPARIAASMFALLHEAKNHCPPAVHLDEEQVRLAEFAAEQILASPPPVILVPECRGMGVAHFVEDPTTGGERLILDYGTEEPGLFGPADPNSGTETSGHNDSLEDWYDGGGGVFPSLALSGSQILYEVDVELSRDALVALNEILARPTWVGDTYNLCYLGFEGALPEVGQELTRLYPVPCRDGAIRGWTSRLWNHFESDRDLLDSPSTSHDLLPSIEGGGYCRALTYRERYGKTGVVPLGGSIRQGDIPLLMAGISSYVPEGVRVFPAVNVGRDCDDGRCVGIGVCCDQADQVPQAMLALHAGINALDLCQFDPAEYGTGCRYALTAKRWAQESNHWVSATPYIGSADQKQFLEELRCELPRGVSLKTVLTRAEGREPWQKPWCGELGESTQAYWLELETDGDIRGPLVLDGGTGDGRGLFAESFSGNAIPM